MKSKCLSILYLLMMLGVLLVASSSFAYPPAGHGVVDSFFDVFIELPPSGTDIIQGQGPTQ